VTVPTLTAHMDDLRTQIESWRPSVAAAPAEPVVEQRAMFAPSDGLDALLDAMEGELAAVEVALVRLDAGTYWTCEVTGAPLPDELLAEHPAARRLGPS